MRKNYRNSGKSTSCVNTLKNGYNRTFYVTYIYHDLKKNFTSNNRVVCISRTLETRKGRQVIRKGRWKYKTILNKEANKYMFAYFQI